MIFSRRLSAYQINIINHLESFFTHLFRLFFFSFALKGFLIIPKKVEQNQTKIFDRDKATVVGNFSVPNAISDSNKDINSFKSIKNTTPRSSDLNNAINKNSSNQLTGGNETELTTFFSTANFTNITSQVGSIVEIPCTVHHLGEGTVSAGNAIKFIVSKLPFVPGHCLLLLSKCIGAFGIIQQVVFGKFFSIEFMTISQ
jgi:hypothetical protein